MLTANHSPLITLCIDTITPAAGITVLIKANAFHSPIDPHMASEGIIEAIDQTLKQANIKLDDLEAVLVIKGPGSFTGLRVGISVANQFSHQLKIPILGLTTDEWGLQRTDERSPLFVQSMNKQEVYVADDHGAKIIPIEELSELGERSWLGELKFDHAEKLPSNLTEIKELRSIEEAWAKVIEVYQDRLHTKTMYELVEPFYGKEPNITKPKH